MHQHSFVNKEKSVMKIIIKCDCGNEITITAPAGKYTQFRDYIEAQQFRFAATEIKSDVLKEFEIKCNKCKKHIVLGVD